MKIITILGARPQFIKAGAVSRIFAKNENIEEIIVHTGQHYDKNMSDYFFNQLEIPKPKYMLKLGGSTHGAMTGMMMKDLEEIFTKEKPDFVMVYGDTNSTIAGALTASKMHIKVAHVEAGLRSFNMKMPEEVNRILTDRISSILFCPTDAAIKNLQKEGFDAFDIKVVNNGDVMQDAAIFYAGKSEAYSTIIKTLGLKKGEFVADVEYANLRALNFVTNDSLSIFKGEVDIKLEGATINDAVGSIQFNNTYYLNEYDASPYDVFPDLIKIIQWQRTQYSKYIKRHIHLKPS